MASAEKRNWFQISDTIIEDYTVYPLNSMLKNLPLEVFLTAASGFSGPIALLEDKSVSHQFILPNYFHEAIVILNCKG